MHYSLRRVSSLDSVDGGTHNPTVCGSDVPTEVVPETEAQAGWDRSEMFPEAPDLDVLPGPVKLKNGLNYFDGTTGSKWDMIETSLA
jgi:hypothetical protein